MKRVTELPERVSLIRNEWVPLPDGTRLAARIWLPECAQLRPVPAILEYIPYRKGDGTSSGDAVMHGYFAGHGYASVRVDIRGSGDSDGVLTDEYTVQEHQDGLAILRWLAEQPWCTGSVGMIGISWGGFNSLQIAALKPPQLKAIISVCSTDDRYANDEHYMGGCLEASEMGQWANELLALRGLPPDPSVVGECWREMWFRRLEALEPTLPRWISHQRRDGYWKHGSVCEDYSAMECAVYMVGGWQDGYRDAVLRMLQNYQGPRKGLLGPWGHMYPHEGSPGPAIGFLQHALRWWDHWLKGVDTGIMREPMLTAWMQEPVRPERQPLPREGRWVTEAGWPADTEKRRLALDSHGLGTGSSPAEEAIVDSPPEVGLDAGCWISWTRPSDFASDQRADDGRSVTFTTEPFLERMEVFGTGELVLSLSSDSPHALLAARMCDVFPDGASTQITRGALNLTHRESHEVPAPLEPFHVQQVRIPLQATAYALEPGHRLRVSVTTSLWPLLWPSPCRATIRLRLDGSSWLELPVRAGRDACPEPGGFDEAEGADEPDHELLEAPLSKRVIRRDADDGRIVITWDQNMRGSRRYAEDGLEFREGGRETYTIVEGEPLSAEVTSEWHTSIGRDRWRTRVGAVSKVAGDDSFFYVSSRIDAYQGEALVFSRSWDDRIPRDMV
jgi:uncharacterized protein